MLLRTSLPRTSHQLAGVCPVASPAALETSDWCADADDWIEWRATQPGNFTADDLRRAVPDAPSPYLPGLAFRKASTRGLIESDTAQRSTVRSRKGSLLCTWRGVAEGVTQ